MYSCDHCSYETNKKANFLRHLNRKFKCHTIDENVHDPNEKVTRVHERVPSNNNEYISLNENIPLNQCTTDQKTNASKKVFKCEKCNKELACQQNLNYHYDRCDGFPKNQCTICLKIFVSPKAKYKHKRNVSCKPPPPPPLPEDENKLENSPLSSQQQVSVSNSTTTINNNNNNHNTNTNCYNTTNSHNNITNNITNNIIAFGDEGIKQLEEFFADKPELIESLKKISKKKFYGMKEIQNQMFFNPENPDGMTIIKPNRYGTSVKIKNSEGEFEYREFGDVRDMILDYIEAYVGTYNEIRKKLRVEYSENKELNLVSDFFTILCNEMDIYLPDDLIKALGIVCKPSSSNLTEEDEEKKYKKFDRMSLDNIHQQTVKNFKYKQGQYLQKNQQTNT